MLNIKDIENNRYIVLFREVAEIFKEIGERVDGTVAAKFIEKFIVSFYNETPAPTKNAYVDSLEGTQAKCRSFREDTWNNFEIELKGLEDGAVKRITLITMNQDTLEFEGMYEATPQQFLAHKNSKGNKGYRIRSTMANDVYSMKVVEFIKFAKKRM